MRGVVKDELHSFYARHHVPEGIFCDTASTSDDRSLASDSYRSPSKLTSVSSPAVDMGPSSSCAESSERASMTPDHESEPRNAEKKPKTFKSVSEFWGAFGKTSADANEPSGDA